MTSKLMPKPKTPDTSAQQKALADQEKRIAAQEAETKARDERSSASKKRARSGRNAARQSLITAGNEVGVTSRTTLG